MGAPLWVYDSARQALIFFNPGGQGTGFHIPALEKLDYWEPKAGLELAFRKTLPPPGGPMIQPAAAIPPQFRGISPNGRRR
jgi:hypothetical protein